MFNLSLVMSLAVYLRKKFAFSTRYYVGMKLLICNMVFQMGLAVYLRKKFRSRNNSFLSILATCFIVFFNSFSLKPHSINFLNKILHSKSKKFKIEFEIHLSTNEVHFLDVTASLNHEKLRTTLFIKHTDSYFYLNNSSCHPAHVLKNIPKGQFIRFQRICSQKSVKQSNLV